MKFMKLGTRPDIFYTKEAIRSVSSDVPSDLIIQLGDTRYLLHKSQLLPKCGLLQRICSVSANSTEVPIELHDIPGGEEPFELCAKFCYGITISISAHTVVPALCAAKFLRMTESVEKSNFVLKLEAFFNSCILDGWKDSIIALQTTGKLQEWPENLGIIRRCINSIVEKILTDPSKVAWSYAYTRPGYAEKRHHSIPKDWWTEDISDLDIDHFQCIIIAVQATNVLPPQLIGEALHVYACRWLPNTSKTGPPESSKSQNEEAVEKHRRVLDTIVSMIPAERVSVSIGFLLRLLNEANFLGVSSPTKAELTRRSGRQLEEATVNDLLLPSHLISDKCLYDIDLVEAVLESFLLQRRRQANLEGGEFLRLIRKVAKLIDSYLQLVARDVNLSALKIASLAGSLPDIARPKHDDLYKAINIYLKEHPNLSKAEKKRLCRVLDCQKLSPEVCAHAVKNERLPLRTVVQVLFFEKDRGASPIMTVQKPSLVEKIPREEPSRSVIRGEGRSKTKSVEKSMSGMMGRKAMSIVGNKDMIKMVVREMGAEKGRETKKEGMSQSK